MFEIDFLPVGDESKSGDAICMRFVRPDSGEYAVVVIDAGYKDDGEALVAHVPKYYGTYNVDLAILTHPDEDHINGMGEVVRGLNVSELWVHDIGAHGGSSLPAAEAVRDLMNVAAGEGTTVTEPWAGDHRFGGALTLLGPTEAYYNDLVREQVQLSLSEARVTPSVSAAVKSIMDRIASVIPAEIPFGEGDVNPRNNSSMINMLRVDGKTKMFTADAGVPALERAWDQAEAMQIAAPPDFVQMPHHGSRHNCSSAWLDRLLGPNNQAQGVRTAFVSCAAKSEKYPSGRVWNAHMRRGCNNFATEGRSIRHQSDDAPVRVGWTPLPILGAMEEEPADS